MRVCGKFLPDARNTAAVFFNPLGQVEGLGNKLIAEV